MLFFKSLAVFSTLAFGALSALAAPAASAVENGLVARCDCDSIPTIFADVKADLKVHIDALVALTADACVEATVAPIVADIKVVLSDAVVKVKALVGQPVDVILGANVDVHVLASIVADLVLYVFAAIRVVLNVCLSVNLNVCIALFASLGEVLAALVFAVINVTANVLVGLDVAILALIGACIDVIVKLNVRLFISVLGISL